MTRRIGGWVLAVIGALGELGALQPKEPTGPKIGLAIFFLLMIGCGVWLIATAAKDDKRRAAAAEQQKLLALASEAGTLSSPRIVAGLGWSKEEADAALTRLRQSGLAELDVDESGTPVYRVSKDALAVRQVKTR